MPEPVEGGALTRSWTHAHEEDSGDQMVFRPSEGDFPPSRGRDTLSLLRGGELGGSGPGPDDSSRPKGGGWRLDGRVLTIADAGQSSVKYEIESVDNEKLILKRTES